VQRTKGSRWCWVQDLWQPLTRAVSWLEFRVVAVAGFRFVAEVEGLDVGEWGRSLQHLISISSRLRRLRAIGCEFGVRSVKSAS
jgi:hypothetical protein